MEVRREVSAAGRKGKTSVRRNSGRSIRMGKARRSAAQNWGRDQNRHEWSSVLQWAMTLALPWNFLQSTTSRTTQLLETTVFLHYFLVELHAMLI